MLWSVPFSKNVESCEIHLMSRDKGGIAGFGQVDVAQNRDRTNNNKDGEEYG